MRRNRLLLAIALAAAILTFSASSVGHSAGDGEGKQAASRPGDMPPPAGTPLAQVELGMNDTDVRRIMGEPSSSNNYRTGKSWIPFYYGSDTHRSDWMYPGVGRVVFSRNRYSGRLKVVRVLYNPDEP